MILLYQLFICFILYSFLGWVCEVIYCSIPAKRFINRGFLNGPFCPVYGFGALLVVFLLTPLAHNMVLLYVGGVLATSILEYITAYLLEVLFHTKWWDYSTYRFNIHGRVCLKNALLFGCLSIVVMSIIHPSIWHMVRTIPTTLLLWLSLGFTLYFTFDLFITIRSMIQLNKKLEQLQLILQEIRQKAEFALEEKRESIKMLRELPLPEALEILLGKVESSRLYTHLYDLSHNYTFLHRRILDAFPRMQSLRNPESLQKLKQTITQMRLEKKSRKK